MSKVTAGCGLDTGAHYDAITDGWQLIFGANFHWGYFSQPEQTLDQATTQLIDFMADLGPIHPAAKLLDIGCGIGTPALYLHQKYRCPITAVTNSPQGARVAQEAAQKQGCEDQVEFQVADFLSDFSTPKHFDVAWIMEVAHLIKDKRELVRRCHDLLVPGGKLLLCDVMLKQAISPLEIVRKGREVATLARTFGNSKTETMDYYQRELKELGYLDIHFIDVSEEVYPTLQQWRQRIARDSAELSQRMAPAQIADFLESCAIMESWYSQGWLGYGVLSATK